MVSYEQFKAESAPLKTALELRRRKYLRYFYAGVALGLFLLATAVFCPDTMLQALQRLLFVKAPLRQSDIAAYRAFTLLCTLSLALGPVMSYRGTHGFLIEHAIMTRFLGLFGSFIPAQGGGISSAELKMEGFATAPFLFYPEEGASGEVNGVRVRLCEASLLARDGENLDRLVFHGLVVLLGKPRATGGLDPDEAELHERLALAAKANGQAARWDEKMLYASKGLYSRMKEVFLAGTGKDELPAEKRYRMKYHLPQRVSRYGQPDHQDALVTSYAIEYSQQSCLVLIVGLSGFFALGSLFAPAWDEMRSQGFFEVMQMLDSVTQNLKRA